MMKITCERGLIKRTGLIGFKWTANFVFKFHNPAEPFVSRQFGSYITELRKLTGIFCYFTDWLTLQADYPDEGHICSITLTPADKDELDNYLLGKILTSLKISYREAHPKVVCQSDKGGI